MYSTSVQNLATCFSRSRYIIACVKTEYVACEPDHAYFVGGLSSDSYDSI